MNQFLDIAGSYVIGGIVLGSIVSLMFFYSAKSQEAVLSEISQRNVTEVGSIIEHDFNKLGYRIENSNKIISLDSTSIKFLSDLENQGVVDTITYSMITENNKKLLKRRVGSSLNSSEWTFPVENVTISGINSSGEITYNPASVKSVKFGVLVSEETIQNSATLVGAFWQRQFFPKNLF
jgi:hypothetical protein